MTNKLFQNTGALSPGKSVFDLSYTKTLTGDMGKLYPIMADEVVPGDFWKFGNQSLIRFQPLVAPVMHEMNVYVHYFFVPYRLLWNNDINTILSADEDTKEDIEALGSWESFITGGENGDSTDVQPTWEPSSGKNAKGTLWDYLGLPTGVDPDGAYPVDYPRRAYNLIFNEYYRDENLQQTETLLTNEDILIRNWEKDYLTSSLPFQQRGTSPALPIQGFANAEFSNVTGNATVGGYSNSFRFLTASPNDDFNIYNGTAQELANAEASLSNNVVDLSDGTAFDVNDIRVAFQIQRWMERNARAGARYTEFLKAHFGTAPRDDRMQRPEYLGGSKNPVIISEVLQTSETDTSPQGNLAGHGIALSDAYAGSYKAQEFGLIMGIMSVMPIPMYQQGINRQWLRQTRYDYYFPEFANLSEQAVLNAEVVATDVEAENEGIFGYQGRYDEMRVKQNMVCAEMRDTFDYWHLGRQFTPDTVQNLNESFIQCVPRKDIFAVPSEDGLIIQFQNIIKAFRPLPITAEPGLIDHD